MLCRGILPRRYARIGEIQPDYSQPPSNWQGARCHQPFTMHSNRSASHSGLVRCKNIAALLGHRFPSLAWHHPRRTTWESPYRDQPGSSRSPLKMWACHVQLKTYSTSRAPAMEGHNMLPTYIRCSPELEQWIGTTGTSTGEEGQP